MGPRQKKIIHVDMDAFFAAVEERENPALKGRPLAVGGSPDSRGVVATANYVARAYGVRSAMTCRKAYELCPEIIFLPPQFSLYKEVSRQVMEIFHLYTPLVEAMSLDEAYLDVSEDLAGLGSATETAKEIRRLIFERTKLTASAGVAPNKFLAKIASEMNKPNGLTVIRPQDVSRVLENLPVRKVPGVGRVTEQRLLEKRIRTLHDLRRETLQQLEVWFGRSAEWLFAISRGEDDREVEPWHERKSVGAEDTFAVDLREGEQIKDELRRIMQSAWGRLKRAEREARTLTVKIRYANFETITRSRTSEQHYYGEDEALSRGIFLLEESLELNRSVRLLGASFSNLLTAEQAAEKRKFKRAVQLHLPGDFL